MSILYLAKQKTDRTVFAETYHHSWLLINKKKAFIFFLNWNPFLTLEERQN